jgi:hypothetical protein
MPPTRRTTEIAVDESEYLEEQCRRAKAGMRLALRALKIDAIESVDPRVWARAHPWKTVAAAAAAGFAVTKIAEREAEPVKPRATTEAQPQPVEHRPGRLATLISLAGKLWSLAQPLIRAAVIAKMSEHESHQQPAPAA